MNLNKKLSDILDPNKIEVVKNPIEKAHGLPNECYLNNDYLEFEKEKIFKNNWTMIGVASSVPNPGDAKPFNLHYISQHLIHLKVKLNISRPIMQI